MKHSVSLPVMHKSHRTKPKIEFAMTGVLTGLFAGMLLGFIIEIGAGGSSLMMTFGAIVGITIGSVCETIRFAWRKRHPAGPPVRKQPSLPR